MEHPKFIDLFTAQLTEAIPGCTDSYIAFMGSDDRWDYLKGALALGQDMLLIQMDGQPEDNLLDLLNLKPWENYACDGVANEIWNWINLMGDNEYWYEELEDDHVFETLPVLREVT